MNISTNTLSVLKNFSDINQNILVKPGNTIQTISTMKNILAEAEVSEKFDSEFAIYDLPEFLRAVESYEKPALKFNGGSNVTIHQGEEETKYFFADKSVIVAPTKAINMPDQYVSFTLKKDHFDRLQKQIATLNLPDVAVVGDGKNIKLVATDKKNKSSNGWSKVIGETDKKFNAYFKAENLKIIGDDYDVEISQQKISHFVNRNKPVKYWIALEPDSEF